MKKFGEKISTELELGPVSLFIFVICLASAVLVFVSGGLDQWEELVTLVFIMGVALYFGRSPLCKIYRWLTTPVDKNRITIIVDGGKKS